MPTYQFFRFFRRRRANILLSLLLTVLVLTAIHFVFWKIYIPGIPPVLDETHISMKEAVSRISFIGVTLLAVLTGYGSVSFSYSSLAIFIRPVDDFELEAVRHQLQHCLESILQRKRKVLLLKDRSRRAGGAFCFCFILLHSALPCVTISRLFLHWICR